MPPVSHQFHAGQENVPDSKRSGSSFIFLQQDRWGNTPLHIAAKEGHLATVRLLRRGSSLYLPNKQGKTPMMLLEDAGNSAAKQWIKLKKSKLVCVCVCCQCVCVLSVCVCVRVLKWAYPYVFVSALGSYEMGRHK